MTLAEAAALMERWRQISGPLPAKQHRLIEDADRHALESQVRLNFAQRPRCNLGLPYGMSAKKLSKGLKPCTTSEKA